MAVRETESSRDPSSFHCQHQLVDEDICLGAIVGGWTAGGAVTCAVAGRRRCCDAERFQLGHGGHILFLHCVVVATVSDSITTVLLVAAADRAPKWLSNCSMKEDGAPAMWLP